MNTRLLKSKLDSIAHYEEEIKKAKEVVSTLESIKKDIVASLAEFCPFQKGDLLYENKSNMPYEFIETDGAGDSMHDKGPGVIMKLKKAGNYTNGLLSEKVERVFFFSEASKWSILRRVCLADYPIKSKEDADE